MTSFIRTLVLSVFLVVAMLFMKGCGSTTTMSCDKYVGPEKDECINTIKLRQERMIDRIDRMDRIRMNR